MTRALIATLVVCGAIAAWRATAFLPSINGGAPLARMAPVTTPAGSRLSRKVVLVIVDGLRADAADQLMTTRVLALDGVETTARAPFPTLSMPNYVTLITGVPPRFSGYRTNDLHDAGDAARVPFDSLFARVRAAGLRIGFSSGDARTAMPVLFAGTIDDVAPTVDEVVKDDLVVVLLMEADHAGHAHGGVSSGYREAVGALDSSLVEILHGLDPKLDTMIITSDHGHADRGGHGGDSPGMSRVPFVMGGAGVRRKLKIDEIDLADVAPTIAALLGVPAPGHGAGSTLIAALDVDARRATALAAADRLRIDAVRAAEAEIEGAADDAHRSATTVRLTLGALAIAMLGALLYWLHRRRLLRFQRAAFVLGVVGTGTFLAAARTGEHWASEPGVPGDRGSLWLEYARYGLLAAGVMLVVHLIALRFIAPARRRDALLASLACGLALVIAFALAVWALVGQTGATTLPSPWLVVITPVAYMGVTWYAIGALATFGASVTAWLRREYPSPP